MSHPLVEPRDMKSTRKWGIGAVVPARPMDPPVYPFPEDLEPGAMVRVVGISPGYCRVRLAREGDSREWLVAWQILKGWTYRPVARTPCTIQTDDRPGRQG